VRKPLAPTSRSAATVPGLPASSEYRRGERRSPCGPFVPNPTPSAAVAIVVAEERRKQWSPRVLGAREQKRYGCDIISMPPPLKGGDPAFIEVKGWGRPFLTTGGKWSWPDAVVQESQLRACRESPTFRLEIVANLDAYLADGSPYERLTLTAEDVIGNETKRVVHAVKLTEPLKARIRRQG
jgi:hypothetical protein